MPNLSFFNMFCVECGKEEKNYDGLCIECYIKRHHFFSIPSQVIVTYCKNCDSYRINSTWKKANIRKDIKSHIIKKIKTDLKYKCELNIEKRKVTCRGEFEGKTIKEEKEIKIIEKQKLCPQCSLMKGGYFTAIIQVRGAKEEKWKKINDVIKKTVKERNSFISKTEKVRGGLDYYVSNKKVAERAIRDIKELFGGEITKSSSLVGMKNGKKIFRNTYSIRFSEYSGKFIKINEKLYQVITVGKKIELKGVNGEMKYIDKKDIKKARILDIKPRSATVLSSDVNNLYVMDSKDFKTLEVNKPRNWKNKKNINIVEYDGNIYPIDEYEKNNLL